MVSTLFLVSELAAWSATSLVVQLPLCFCSLIGIPVKTSKKLKTSLAVLALSLTVSAPARADKVLCDGNMLCLVVAVPVLVTGVAIGALIDKAKGTVAPKVDRGEVGELEQLLRDKPGLAH